MSVHASVSSVTARRSSATPSLSPSSSGPESRAKTSSIWPAPWWNRWRPHRPRPRGRSLAPAHPRPRSRQGRTSGRRRRTRPPRPTARPRLPPPPHLAGSGIPAPSPPPRGPIEGVALRPRARYAWPPHRCDLARARRERQQRQRSPRRGLSRGHRPRCRLSHPRPQPPLRRPTPQPPGRGDHRRP